MIKLHEVFEPSFDWKECRTEKFIEQKLNYIHWNPCKGVKKLADLPEQYIHSSGKFYITGEQGIYPVTSYMELRDIDLTVYSFAAMSPNELFVPGQGHCGLNVQKLINFF